MIWNRRVLLVFVFLYAGACASSPSLIVRDELPDGAPKGYVEFYCSFCLANVTVFRLEDDTDVHVANIAAGHTIASALQSPIKPLRLKRIRVAQSPGDQVYRMKLLSPALSGSTSTTVTASVRETRLTPIRIDYFPETRERFRWRPVVGRPIPLDPSPASLGSLHVAPLRRRLGNAVVRHRHALLDANAFRRPLDEPTDRTVRA